MNEKRKCKCLVVLRFLPLILCAVCMSVYLFSGEDITAEGLLNYAPEEPLLAALFLLALYAFKSLTIVFPIIVLNVLGGFLFEPCLALLINMLGVLIDLLIPYWIGRASGASSVKKLTEKYPKIAAIIGTSERNPFFISFFLRVISFLPGNAVSMVFGANRMLFSAYLFGSLLGSILFTVAATLLGINITDPASPMFWVSVVLTVGISVVSVLIYLVWRKTKRSAL